MAYLQLTDEAIYIGVHKVDPRQYAFGISFVILFDVLKLL